MTIICHDELVSFEGHLRSTLQNNSYKGYKLESFSGQSFRIFLLFFFIVAIFDQVHDMETIFHLL